MAQDTTPLPNTVVAAATSANAANAATAPDSHELSFLKVSSKVYS